MNSSIMINITNVYLFILGLSSITVIYYNGINTLPEGDILAKFIIYSTTVYFSVDFVQMLIYYHRRNNIYFVHHGIALLSIFIGQFIYPHMKVYLVSYFIFEISTPFLNFSIEYKQRGIDNGYSKMAQLMFVTLFFMSRIVFGSYLLFSIVNAFYGSIPMYVSILPVGIQFMNYYWGILLFAKIKKQFLI